MPHFPTIYFILFALLFGTTHGEETLESPDRSVSATVFVDHDGQLKYTVDFKEKQVVEPSSLGITVDGASLGAGVEFGQSIRSASDTTYQTRGNDPTARDHYNAFKLPVIHTESGRQYQLEARAYNDGFAYRYLVPGEGTQHINSEQSSWTIMPKAKTWYFERLNPGWKLKSYAGEWLSTDIAKLHTATPAKIGPVQGTPLVLELPENLGYAAVTKAALYNYSGMRLEAVGNRTVVANFTEEEAGFDVEGDILTPWRVTLLANNLNELVNSDLIKNLNPAPDPKLFADTSYIKPGRSVWSWEPIGLGTPDDQKHFIDLAAKLGFEFSTVDDGWKDWDDPWGTMKMLCDHGKTKNVGVWLWVHSKDIKDPTNDYEQMKNYFDKVASAGSVGLKIDFMNGETKKLIDFEIAALRIAAERKLLINFHGCHSSTGEERTYPNELTREGIRGIEVNKHKNGHLFPSHNAALPFTRFILGHADYTPILYTNPGPTTLAHQFATQVVFTSALQVYAEHPETMIKSSVVNEALEIMKAIPTAWDETIVLPGSKIGDLAAFARRNGDEWFVGILNGADARNYELSLNFLPEGNYALDLVSDDHKAESVNVADIGINQKAEGKRAKWPTSIPFKVSSTTKAQSGSLKIRLTKGGGFTARIRKK